MKKYFFYIVVVAGFMLSGCSAAFRTAQTPDDVYFSEGQVVAQQTRVSNTNGNDGYTSFWENQDDNYLRMKVQNRNRWGGIDDIDYWNGYNNNMWVNYNTFNNPWAMNTFNSPLGWNNWNRPIGFGHGWGWNNGFNSMLGWNNGFNNMLGWDNGFNMGWNNMGFGLNSWNNNWNNPYSWNRPVVILNKFPTGSSYISPSRGSSSLSPYSRNNNFSRTNGANNSGFTRQPSNVRSIWETPGNNNTNPRNSMYRTIQRSGGGVDGGNRTFDRPARTFDTNSGGGSRSSGGSSSGGSSSGSAGGSSRGGRGG
jgi:hypothetical protein